MTITTPPAIAALPNTITPDITTGLDNHLEAVYAYLKDIAGLVNNEITTATTSLVTASPPGVVMAFAGAAAPTGWLLCSGQNVSRTTYAALFSAIGTAHGVGDGSTTFGIPNLQGRIPVGRDTGQTEFDVLGEAGGAKTHALIASEIPAHTHAISLTTSSDNHNHSATLKGDSSTLAHGHNEVNTFSSGGTGKVTNGTGVVSSDAHDHTVAGDTASVGGGTVHNNLQPYLVMNYIIKI